MAFLRALRRICEHGGRAWTRPWVRVGGNSLVGLLALVLVARTVSLADVAHHFQPRHLSPLLAIAALTVLSQVVRAGGTLLLSSLGLSPGAAAGAIVLWHAVATLLIVSLGLVAMQRVLRVVPSEPAS